MGTSGSSGFPQRLQHGGALSLLSQEVREPRAEGGLPCALSSEAT